MDFGGFDGEHARDVGAGEVNVENSYAEGRVGAGEGEGELYGNGGFADAAFAGEHLEGGAHERLLVGGAEARRWGGLASIMCWTLSRDILRMIVCGANERQ